MELEMRFVERVIDKSDLKFDIKDKEIILAKMES